MTCSPLLQEAAASDLAYAFDHCPRTALANKARCAFYLIPVKMLLGELPKQAMLERFSLQHYGPIVQVRSPGPSIISCRGLRHDDEADLRFFRRVRVQVWAPRPYDPLLV